MDTQQSGWSGDKKLRLLIYLVLLLAGLALLAYSHLTLKQSQFLNTGPSTISVSGSGEAVAVPDIATFSFSVNAESEDAADAQDKSAEAINAITDFLRENGIEERDIKTLSYNLSPRYEFVRAVCNREGFCPPGRQNLVGYSVNQTIEVKVRNTTEAGDLISGVGGLGATNVSNLRFTVDDDDALKAEARANAISDAKEKAEVLADDLGVRLVRILGYHESGPGFDHYGFGGEFAVAESLDTRAVPDLPVGENKTVSNVTLVYEIR